MSRDTQRIRHLNDRFRQELAGNSSKPETAVLTSGIHNLGILLVRDILKAVAEFDAFTEENDPWGEHDFGRFELSGHQILWKIDYYDLQMKYGAENPAIASETRRVITIMLSEEY